MEARKLAINSFLDKTVDTVTRRNAPGLHRTLKKLPLGKPSKKTVKLGEKSKQGGGPTPTQLFPTS